MWCYGRRVTCRFFLLVQAVRAARPSDCRTHFFQSLKICMSSGWRCAPPIDRIVCTPRANKLFLSAILSKGTQRPSPELPKRSSENGGTYSSPPYPQHQSPGVHEKKRKTTYTPSQRQNEKPIRTKIFPEE